MFISNTAHLYYRILSSHLTERGISMDNNIKKSSCTMLFQNEPVFINSNLLVYASRLEDNIQMLTVNTS